MNDTLRPRRKAAFIATLMAAGGCIAATDYPPPPGAYQSEPMRLRELPTTPRPAATGTGEQSAVPQTEPSSRQLAIPPLSPTRVPGAYDAANLFGSTGTISEGDPQGLLQPLSNPRPTPIETPNAAEPTVDSRGFTLDPEGRNGATGYRDVPRYGPAAPVYYGYPQFAPAYPAYGQYPGQGMQYVPQKTPEAGYPGYFDAYRQGIPIGATGGRGIAAPPTGHADYSPMGPGPQTIQSPAPYPAARSQSDYPRQQDLAERGTGTTFRAVTADAPSGASPAPAAIGDNSSDGGASLPGNTMMFRPPELLPGR